VATLSRNASGTRQNQNFIGPEIELRRYTIMAAKKKAAKKPAAKKKAAKKK
jgi:hypothetical protein